MWALWLLFACDPNGPHCTGRDDCVLWMPSEDAPCWDFRTVPRQSTTGGIHDLSAATWVKDGEEGCYFVSMDAFDIPEGFSFAPSGHWCAERLLYGPTESSAFDEECAAWYDEWYDTHQDESVP